MKRKHSASTSVLVHDLGEHRLSTPASFTSAQRSERAAEATVCVGGLLIGLAFAAYLYGWGILDVRNVAWLLDVSDTTIHFLGWDFFRHDHWRWPPGINPTLGYVTGNSIVFSDSLPLLALVFKAFRAVLPDPFQYQGLILYGDFMLNGCFAALLAYRLSGQIGASMIIACLVVTGTIVTNRGFGAHGHDTLTAHWLILAAFLLVWTRQTDDFKRTRPAWVLLIALSTLIHFYLLVMVLAIWMLELISLGMAEPRAWAKLIRHGMVVAVSLFAVAYLAGYFSGVSTASANGFGFFSANVLTFFDPHSGAWFFQNSNGVTSFSKFMPALPERGVGQYEGQAYMGVGLLMMIGLGTCCWLMAKPLNTRLSKPFRFSRGAHTLAIAALLLALLAFSNVIDVGDREILNLPLAPQLAALLGVIRSSGRFIWVLYYLLMFSAFLGIVRTFSATVTFACLFFVLVVQMVDLAPWHGYLHNASRHLPDAPEVTRDADVNRFMSHAERMVFLPVKSIPDGFAIFSFIAARHGMTVNTTYTARRSDALLERANRDETNRLLSGAATPDEVYVVTQSSGLPETACKQKTMTCLQVGAQTVLMRAHVE